MSKGSTQRFTRKVHKDFHKIKARYKFRKNKGNSRFDKAQEKIKNRDDYLFFLDIFFLTLFR